VKCPNPLAKGGSSYRCKDIGSKQKVEEMEIPTLTEVERQKAFTRIWVKHIHSATSFIREKLGSQGLEEYNERRTKQSAEQFKVTKRDNPTGFTIAQATTAKNIFGSKVEVSKNEDGNAIFDIKECARLRTALDLANDGLPITRAQYCGLYINRYYERVAGKLGLKMETKFTDKGCKMTIGK